MKKNNIWVMLLALSTLLFIPDQSLDAQDWEDPTKPISQIRDVDDLPFFLLPTLDNDALMADEELRRSNGVAPKFAEVRNVQIAPDISGQWDHQLKAGYSIWRYRIISDNAKSLNLGFSHYTMPEGGKLFLYTPDLKTIRGPFTENDNEDHKEMWSPVLPGDEIVIEVQVPSHRMSNLELELSFVNHGFTGFYETLSYIRSGSCNVDVICPDGDGYRDIIRSVAVISTGGSTFCTGFLVNNTANDEKPYFMTANHCGIGSGNAASLVVYWNFENSTCRTPGSSASGGAGNGSLSQFNTGSIFRSSYSPSDFSLVELDDPINCAFNVFYAGWDRRNQATSAAIAIHHPSTDEKRISFENNATSITAYLSSSVNSSSDHIRVADWDLGTTEPGSSGSPLYSPEKRVIGQLHGGYAACGNNDDDWYGRIYTSWTGGGSSSSRLSNWLDPIGTGVQTLDGLNACGAPCTISNITSGSQTACVLGLNTYTQQVTVTYADEPSTGSLVVNGQSFPITSSPQTVTLTGLNATGSGVDVTASFSDNGSCPLTVNNLFTSPAACTPIVCQTYNSSNVPVTISASGTPTITSTISITDNNTIQDINVVNLNGTHTWIGDLDFALTSPAGTNVELIPQNCGNVDDFDLELDDEATSATIPCPPTGGGSYQPAGLLSDFDGESTQGTWTLTINDNASADGGILQGWGLEICAFGTVVGCPMASNLNTTNLTSSSVTLQWTPAIGADHYVIRGGLAGSNPTNYIYLTIPSGTSSFFNVSGLTPSISYEWQINTYCDAAETDESGWTSLNVFTTIGCQTPALAFSNNVTSTTATLNWSLVPGASSYNISGGVQGGPTVNITLGGNTSSFSVSGLTPNTTYVWQVRTVCPGSASPYTALQSFTTSSSSKVPANGSTLKLANVTVFPNPNNGSFGLLLNDLEIESNLSIQIFNVLGAVVVDQSLDANEIDRNSALNFTLSTAGTYFIRVQSGNSNIVKKLVVN